MTDLKPISEIEKELYEVLADKTLSRGCMVGNPFQDTDNPYHRAEFLGKEKKYKRKTFKLLHHDGHIGNLIDDAETELILYGHEPTLNDVLLELGKNWHASIERGFLGVWFLRGTYGDNIFTQEYDLTKSFDNQSEETKRKLHELICKK